MNINKIKTVLYNAIKAWDSFNRNVMLWMEWQNAKYWAEEYHPAWVYLATQRNRPELREMYRDKIVREYYESYFVKS